MDSINSRIAEELGVRPQQVEAAVALLDEGSTVPFIARNPALMPTACDAPE